MAAQLTATDEDIVQMGERLLKEGKTVTGWTIRSALGTGNGNRLCQIWDGYVASRRPTEQPSGPLPGELQDMLEVVKARHATELETAVRDVWRSAEQLASSRLTAEIETQRALVAQAEASLGAAQSAIDAAEVERDQARAEIERVRVRLNDALRTHIEVEVVARAATARANQSDDALREMSASLRASDEERGRLQGIIEGMKTRARPASAV